MKADKQISRYPSSRLATHDVGKISRSKHHVAGFLEVDVTNGKRLIRDLVRDGKQISFISWLVKEVSTSISQHMYMNTINGHGTTQTTYRDINISIPIEKTIDGQRVPIAKLLLKTNDKSIEEIHSELTEGRTRIVSNERDYTLTEKWYSKYNKLFFRLPQFLRLVIWKLILMTPDSIQRSIGTTIITTTGTPADTPAWILPRSIHNLCIGLGSIVKKDRLKGSNAETRYVLHMTVMVDHDVVDGLPASKFISTLVRNIESASQLK